MQRVLPANGTEINQLRSSDKKNIIGGLVFDPRTNEDQFKLYDRLLRAKDASFEIFLTDRKNSYLYHSGIMLLKTSLLKDRISAITLIGTRAGNKRKILSSELAEIVRDWIKRYNFEFIGVGRKFIQFRNFYDFKNNPDELEKIIKEILSLEPYFDEPGFEAEEIKEQLIQKKLLCLDWWRE